MTTSPSTEQTAPPAPRPQAANRNPIGTLTAFARGYPVVQVAALVALVAYAFATIPGLNTRFSIYAILVLAAFLGLAAIGQTIVIPG